jgi:2-hydroxychromene-2-carboxylate isomerase
VPLFPPNGAEAQRAVQQANPVDCADAVLVALFRCMSYVRQEEIVKRDMNLALAILKTLEENKSPHLSEFDMAASNLKRNTVSYKVLRCTKELSTSNFNPKSA